MANLISKINNDYGNYWYYSGRLFNNSEEELNTVQLKRQKDTQKKMKKESRNIVGKLTPKNIKKENVLDKKVLQELEKIIKKEINIENKLRKELLQSDNIKFNSDNSQKILEDIQKLDDQLTEKIILNNKNLAFINIISSKAFLDSISIEYSTLSFTIAGGARGFQDIENSKDKRNIGKNKINQAVSRILKTKDKNKQLAYIMKLLFDDNRKQKDLLPIIEKEMEGFKPVLSNFLKEQSQVMFTKKGITVAEDKVKPFIKKLGKIFQDYFKNTTENGQLFLNNSLQNLKEGKLIPNSVGEFALNLKDSSNDIKGKYLTEMRINFYEIQDGKEIKRKEINHEQILETFLSLVDKFNSEILSEGETRSKIKGYIREVMNKNPNNWEAFISEAWSKSQISGLLGEIAGIVMLKTMGFETSYLGTTKNTSGQSSHVDLKIQSGKSYYGIQVKNYTGSKNSLNLYSDTEFDLASTDANKYLESNLIYCLKFFFANKQILDQLNIKLPSTKDIENLLLIDISQFLRISDLNTDINEKNNFYLINNKIISASTILIQSYITAKDILQDAKENKLIEIIGDSLTPITITEQDIDSSKYKPMNDRLYNNQLFINENEYPMTMESINNKLNIRIKFKGLKVKI